MNWHVWKEANVREAESQKAHVVNQEINYRGRVMREVMFKEMDEQGRQQNGKEWVLWQDWTAIKTYSQFKNSYQSLFI